MDMAAFADEPGHALVERDLAAGAVADVEHESAAAIGPVADEGAAGRGERIDLDAGNVDAVALGGVRG